MDLITKLRYQGYLNTPPLWKGNSIYHFKQIEFNVNAKKLDDSIIFKNQRLGKLVEEFVFYQLKQECSITWICDNLQIQSDKLTVGEIDALYYHNDKPVHLEVIYKFYLYDTLENYTKPLAYWIGPNRKDSLLFKLDKLNSKQFPLLYNELTKTYLEDYNIDTEKVSQYVCFKAQLFLPYHNRSIDISPLNPNCVKGFYMSYNNFELFESLEFYIPIKLDWLVVPHNNVNWIDYASALLIIKEQINKQRSPLIWLKQTDGELIKCFITFW